MVSRSDANLFFTPSQYNLKWTPPPLSTADTDSYDYATAQFLAAAVAQTYIRGDERVLPKTFRERRLMTPGDASKRIATVGSFPPTKDDDRLTIVVAIRGTESVSDWGADFDFNVVPNPWAKTSRGGVLHGGFLRWYAYDSASTNKTTTTTIGAFLMVCIIIALAYFCLGLARVVDERKATQTTQTYWCTVAVAAVAVLLVLWATAQATITGNASSPTETIASLVKSAIDAILEEPAPWKEAWRENGEQLNVLVAGHSLGASAAQLCAVDLSYYLKSQRQWRDADASLSVSCYAFAPPRTGDVFFNQWLYVEQGWGRQRNRKMFSFVHPSDIVSMTPLPGFGAEFVVCGHEIVLNACTTPGTRSRPWALTNWKVDLSYELLTHQFWINQFVCQKCKDDLVEFSLSESICPALSTRPTTYPFNTSFWKGDNYPFRCPQAGGFGFLPPRQFDGTRLPDWTSLLKDVGWRVKLTGSKQEPRPLEASTSNASSAWTLALYEVLFAYAAFWIPALVWLFVFICASFTGYNAPRGTQENSVARRCREATTELFQHAFAGATVPMLIGVAIAVGNMQNYPIEAKCSSNSNACYTLTIL